MEFTQSAGLEGGGLSSGRYIEFILDRVVHDLGNAISGIDSLSRYHLKAGIGDPDLEESLKLIHQSAATSRDLLIQVGNLLHPLEEGEETVRASVLIARTIKLLTTLLPKSIEVTSHVSASEFDLISISGNDFMRRIVALAAYNLGDARVPSGKIELDCEAENGLVIVSYRSTVKPFLIVDEEILNFFANIGTDIAVNGGTDDNCSVVTICFQAAGTTLVDSTGETMH
jgi:hypothetical protein